MTPKQKPKTQPRAPPRLHQGSRHQPQAPPPSLWGIALVTLGIIAMILGIYYLNYFFETIQSMKNASELGDMIGSILIFSALGTQALLYGIIFLVVGFVCFSIGMYLLRRSANVQRK